MFLAMLDGLLLGQLAAPDDDVENTVIRPSLKPGSRGSRARELDEAELNHVRGAREPSGREGGLR